MKDGVRSVGVDVDFHPRLDKMRPRRAFRDLELQRAIGHAIVMADLPLLSSTHRISSRSTPGMGVKAHPGPAVGTAKRALWAGR